LELARRLGFGAVDLGLGGTNGHFHPPTVAADPAHYAEMVRRETDRIPMQLNECFLLNFGWPINSPRVELRRRTLKYFAGVCRFARLAGCRSILLIPGPVHAEWGKKQSLDMSAKALDQLVPIASEHQLLLNIEPDVDSCARDPESAKSLCEQVDGLGLTLDYSHFVVQGIEIEQVDPLMPFARHLHIRQAIPGEIATDWNRGAIEYSAILRKFRSAGYSGLFCIEYLSLSATEEAGRQAEQRTHDAVCAFDRLLCGESP